MGKPWEDVPHIWKDEKAYLNWMRSQIRRIWSRHPIKTSYIKAREVKVEYALTRPVLYPIAHKLSGNTKTVCRCEMCNFYFAKGKMEVDHIAGGEGFSDYAGFLEWQKRMLFLGYEDIQHLCKPCHQLVSTSQRFNCSIADAPKYQKLAEFKKLKAEAQRVKLIKLGLPPGLNGKARVATFQEHLGVL